MGSNLTPVTPESFAKWKRTRMDKKQAEDEAMSKAKQQQNAAGKNTGMSGRDLVSRLHLFISSPYLRRRSSNTTQNGSRTKTTEMPQTTGIWRNTDSRRKTRISSSKNRESQISIYEMESAKETRRAVVVAEHKIASQATHYICKTTTCMLLCSGFCFNVFHNTHAHRTT